MRYIYKVSLFLWVMVFLTLSGPISVKSTITAVTQEKGVVPQDKFSGGQIIRNEETVIGDLFFCGQTITSVANVEGDVIGIGQTINLTGNVLGDVRVGGSSVTLADQIGKNVTVLGRIVTVEESSAVNGSLIAFGDRINLFGKIKGRTIIGARYITLNGEFFGDVDVNNFVKGSNARYHRNSKVKLTVLPNTVIHGTLRFRGTDADIQKGARVADFQWTNTTTTYAGEQEGKFSRYVWKFIRLLLTTVVYFLIGLLLFRLFPSFFKKAAEFTVLKPWSAVGYGSITVFSTIVALIVCIILLILSIIMSPVFGLIFGVVTGAFYVLLFYLATVPTTLWLGGLIFKERSLPYRFGAGLVIFNAGLFILMLLGKLLGLGPLFPALSFIVRFGALLLGAGALLYAIIQVYSEARETEQ